MNAEEIELTNEEYEDILNEIYEPVKICGIILSQGTILKKCDPIAFRCYLVNYTASNEKWKCGECGKEYNNKDDANECCKLDDNEEE